MIMLALLQDGDAIESDVTLTEEGVEEIICPDREVRKGHKLFRDRNQFTSDIEFDI